MEYSILTLTFCLIITVCVQGLGELNDKCITFDQCRRFGYFCARNRTCQCLHPDYVPNKEGSKCVGTIGQECLYDEHCIDGAFCQGQSKCKCKDSFYPNQEGFCLNRSSSIYQGHFVILLLFFCCLRFYL